MNDCRPSLQPGENAATGARQQSARAARALPDAVVIDLWNRVAQAGGSLNETLIRFARLIEAEVSR